MCHDFYQATDVYVHINAVSQLSVVKGPNVIFLQDQRISFETSSVYVEYFILSIKLFSRVRDTIANILFVVDF